MVCCATWTYYTTPVERIVQNTRGDIQPGPTKASARGIGASPTPPNKNGYSVDEDVVSLKEEILKSRELAILRLPSCDILTKTAFDLVVSEGRSDQVIPKERLEIFLEEAPESVLDSLKTPTDATACDRVPGFFSEELDFGRVLIRVNASVNGHKNEVINQCKSAAKRFLERTLVR